MKKTTVKAIKKAAREIKIPQSKVIPNKKTKQKPAKVKPVYEDEFLI